MVHYREARKFPCRAFQRVHKLLGKGEINEVTKFADETILLYFFELSDLKLIVRTRTKGLGLPGAWFNEQRDANGSQLLLATRAHQLWPFPRLISLMETSKK